MVTKGHENQRYIVSRIFMAKAAFTEKIAVFFTCRLVLSLRKELAKCYIRSKAFCGAVN
jgi:hypothetical protein